MIVCSVSDVDDWCEVVWCVLCVLVVSWLCEGFCSVVCVLWIVDLLVGLQVLCDVV